MFGFDFDRKNLIIILVIVAILLVLTQGTEGIILKLLTLPGILIALTFHEFAHAFAATRLRR